MTLIDFSNCKVVNTKLYGDSNGKKKGIIYNNEKELEKRVFTFPNSALKKFFKLSPYFFTNSFEDVDCKNALYEIFPKIDIKNFMK